MRKIGKIKQVYVSPDGVPMKATLVDKYFRDIVRHQLGERQVENKLVTVYDPARPIGDTILQPSLQSPICQKCDLHSHQAENPFMAFRGSSTPLITVIFENVSHKEDKMGALSHDGFNYRLREQIKKIGEPLGITAKDIRWVSLTRCANREKKTINFKSRGNYCRLHLIQDLALHPPKLIMPVGTSALGALCHKSNAQDWAGRLLTYRGWPDDWLTDPNFVLPRDNPIDPDGEKIIGHPLFGPPPGQNARIPMFPVQSPRLVLATQNPYVHARWEGSIRRALDCALKGVTPLSYTRPWYRFTDDVDEIDRTLRALLALPRLTLCYDTETTGVRPWAEDAAIVLMMFRWKDPVTKKPCSIGFPWNYTGLDFFNKVLAEIPRLAPLVLAVLYRHDLLGHNLPFDVLYSFANIPGADLDKLCEAMMFDTWHMIYTLRQRPGTLGLEAITYDYAPDLAGYEEDMTLLIKLHYDTMHPEGRVNGKRGHYANCPKDKWDSHMVPYIMGDVESCYQAHEKVLASLAKTRTYEIPMADPAVRGEFRKFSPPSRAWLYKNIMAPASSVLTKIMGRGMSVDTVELKRLEEAYPIRILEARDKLRTVDQRVVDWCIREVNKDPSFELDLENKTQLKTILFDILQLPIQRLTKNGKKMYGEEPEGYADLSREQLLEFAALDKFTLNMLAVKNEQVRPLQEYRKIFKLYSTYVRPLQNITTEGIDKNERTKDAHLCKRDECVHAQFLLTGTRGGRLSSRNPNLQNLPRNGDVKSMFVSRFTKQGRKGCLVGYDLSQIELRLLACACGDESFVRAYWDNLDLHSLTASRIFKIPYEHFTKDYMAFLQKEGKVKEAKEINEKRQISKTTNFLTGYGGGAFGLQTTLANNGIYLDISDCENIIENFFDSYPALKWHIQRYKSFIKERQNGVAVSLFGRVRIFEEVFSEDKEAISKALRAGYNHLIQSTASDMMLIALIAIENLMREEGLESILVSTVHDSLLIDGLQEELPKIHEIAMLVLNNFATVFHSMLGSDFDTSWMIVPFTGDGEVGLTYADQNKIGANPDWEELVNPK